MPQVKAWMCPRTKKLFRTKAQYMKYLRGHAKTRIAEIKHNRLLEKTLEDMTPLWDCLTFEDIADWMEKNEKTLFAYLAAHYNIGGRYDKWGEISHIEFINMTWCEIATTHSAPMGRPTVWSSDNPKNIPTRRLGWHGRLRAVFRKEDSFTSNRFRYCGINTGTGGSGGNKVFSWDVDIYAEDFPLMAQYENRHAISIPIIAPENAIPSEHEVPISWMFRVDDTTGCKRRRGTQWTDGEETKVILHPDVYWWLREHVGYEYNEAWEVDRWYYPGETLPHLPASGFGADWIALGLRTMPLPEMPQRRYSLHVNKIYFEDVRDAQAFRERFKIWIDNWTFLEQHVGKFSALAVDVNLRDRTTIIPFLGKVIGGSNSWHILESDHDRVMFRLGEPLPTETFKNPALA